MDIPRVLTVAGSDSGGGAGIQADLKTFASLGVHGMSAVTSITAQNTREVSRIIDLPLDIIDAQINAVADDIGFDAIKVGMLHTKSIVELLCKILPRFRVPVVVDPVMLSKAGAKLMDRSAIAVMISKLLPSATVLTPNIREAEAISKLRIGSINTMKQAARVISRLGPEAVVIKGGHLNLKGKAVDTLFWQDQFNFFEAERINSNDTHGTGCTFASAIAAYLAKGLVVTDAVREAKQFVSNAILYATRVGRGHGPVNPAGGMYHSALSVDIFRDIQEGIDIIEKGARMHLLAPESAINLAVALPTAKSKDDIVAVPGRIVKIGSRLKASSSPRLGASNHVANTILAAMNRDRTKRAAINIRYSDKVISECRRLRWSVYNYDRAREPMKLKRKEGATTAWGANQAIQDAGMVPDVIYHLGDMGKEPMVLIIGSDAKEVASKMSTLSERI